MRVYLDNCCYNRLFDDRSNIKNYLEREAILLIFEFACDKDIIIVGSEVLKTEIAAMSHLFRREVIQLVYERMVSEHIELLGNVVKRAKDLASQIGTKPYDSLHFALCEGNTDYFLTTDVKLIKASKRTNLDFRVINPIEFIMEVANDE